MSSMSDGVKVLTSLPTTATHITRGRVATIDLSTPITSVDADFEYFINILKLIARNEAFAGAQFVLIDAYDLNRRFSDKTVVLLYADERHSLPIGWSNCRMILRTYGNSPVFVGGAYGLLARLVDAARYAAFWLRNRVQALRATSTARQRLQGITFEIPLGYCRSAPLEIAPVTERPLLTSFAGSLSNRRLGPLPFRSAADFIKWSSRRRLVAVLQSLAGRRTDVSVRLTRDFASSLDRSANYSEALMATRICVAPRGSAIESFRVFEAARYGCICISEALPPRWFYEGSPVIRVGSWTELEPLLLRLAGDEAELQAHHRAMLAWWHDVLREEAIVGRILNECARRRLPLREGRPLDPA